jgi:hypothetical protein
MVKERDQQKWLPVLRPIALPNVKRAYDLVAKLHALWRIMRVPLTTKEAASAPLPQGLVVVAFSVK